MKLLTPEEVLQAIKDGKPVEIKVGNTKWEILKTYQHNIACLLNEANQFRLAQEMITIGDVEFPKPITEKLEPASRYYIADPTSDILYSEVIWRNDEYDLHYLSVGVVHLIKENAIAHAKALIKLSGGSVND